MKLQDVTTLQWLGIIILFNTTLLGGASQLGDLSLTPGVVKAILAFATLGNGFLGGLVTMFGAPNSQIQNVVANPAAQEALVKAVLAMRGVQHIDVNEKANATLATIAVDPNVSKIGPTPAAEARVQATAASA